MNGNMRVFSFVADSPQTSFSADALQFLKYLTSTRRLSSSLYVNSKCFHNGLDMDMRTDNPPAIQVGTEPFLGSNAKMTMKEFSIEIK